jgi:hypothetical protein
MSILDKILKKRGFNNTSELSPEEKETFDKWERILSDGEMSIDKIKLFCESQVGIIESQFRNIDNSKEKNERLILQHNIYKTIISVIVSPQAERENLEKYLKTLL